MLDRVELLGLCERYHQPKERSVQALFYCFYYYYRGYYRSVQGMHRM